MKTTRREFIVTSAAAAAGLAGAAVFGPLARGATAGVRPVKGKRILILGGTVFLGPALIEAAKAHGHTVTLFNRGVSEKKLGRSFDVEQLHGNRDPNMRAGDTKDKKTDDPNSPMGLETLKGREWDAVIDTSGYVPRIVKASAELLSSSVKQYVFISSISVYKDNATPRSDVTAEVGKMADETVESMGAQFENYGPLKALCEQAAEKAMPGRVANIRPGLIVGPGDPTGRFTYWPVRVDRGGEVMAPGTPEDPIQMVDVRDLAEWVIALIENNTCGVFDAVGPDKGLTMGQIIDGCKAATSADATLTWVPAAFLEKQQVSPWGDMPLWVPPAGESAGMHTRDVSKSERAGLKFRPAAATCKDTLAWWKGLPDGDRFKQVGGIAPEREKQVLAEWHKQKG